MGCALRTCNRTESENTSTRAESVQMAAISSQPSLPSLPSQPSHNSSVAEAEELIQPESKPASTESQRRMIAGQKVNIIVTDVSGSLVSLDMIALNVPSSSRGKRYQLPRRSKTKYLDGDDAYIDFTRKRAARTPNALSLIKRNLFYRSFPLTIARRKSVEKRMKKQKFGPFEEQRYIFKGRGRNSGGSAGSGTSKELPKSVQSLPPVAFGTEFYNTAPINMSVPSDLTTLLQTHKDAIQRGSFTKSDFTYHNTKQSLHNMWAKIYPMEKSEERSVLTKNIIECLISLDKVAEQNEEKKYQQYYAQSRRINKDTGNGVFGVGG